MDPITLFPICVIGLSQEDEIVCEDVTDTGASQHGGEVTDDDDSRSASELANLLKKDFAMIHTLSREEIQVTVGRLQM